MALHLAFYGGEIMSGLSNREAYRLMFREYPDVVDIKQTCSMLGGVGVKTVYRLLQNKEIKGFKIGRAYRIPKISIITYLSTTQNPCQS